MTETDDAVQEVVSAVEEALEDVELDDHDSFVSAKSFADTGYVTVNVQRDD